MISSWALPFYIRVWRRVGRNIGFLMVLLAVMWQENISSTAIRLVAKTQRRRYVPCQTSRTDFVAESPNASRLFASGRRLGLLLAGFGSHSAQRWYNFCFRHYQQFCLGVPRPVCLPRLCGSASLWWGYQEWLDHENKWLRRGSPKVIISVCGFRCL